MFMGGNRVGTTDACSGSSIMLRLFSRRCFQHWIPYVTLNIFSANVPYRQLAYVFLYVQTDHNNNNNGKHSQTR